MKKMIAVCMVCLLLLAVPASAQKGGSDAGGGPGNADGQGNAVGKAYGKENGPGQAGSAVQHMLMAEVINGTPEGNTTPATNETFDDPLAPFLNGSQNRKTDEHHLRIAERQQEHQQEQANRSLTKSHVNPVRYAVHSLLAMENRTGGIGPQVSAIARSLNDSVNATEQAEERIRSRNSIMRMLFGGDDEAAGLIRQHIERNREMIRVLSSISENGTCDDATRVMLQEQIQSLEQEQQRLAGLAGQEFSARGLFGWLWK
ncbi:hypothetical protein FGU65_09645 [Methanoculleus sp. FWC-SCC1]|uniref:Secreted protein n=1 Tax=Methanoculleus frigidifontis TaxID=2584085 RepID=A0ABT8MB34_9EURY|nr:hypothetical protein [Methanoculleus sp. FWC-SCC1]MDN7025149.1 hypothetical protein [Methanoculleus sp. FWC-SCC1]